MGSGTSNLAQLIPAYFVGPQGQQLTPEQIERQRAMAQTLLERATDTSPNAGGWASVIAKGLQGYQAGRENRLAIDAERANTEASQKNIAAMLGGGGLTPQPSASPMTGAPQSVTAPAMSGDSASIFNEFMGGIREKINNPFALAAIAGTGQRESAFSPQNVRRTWSDPSESGQAGTAGGIMSWRGPRYQALAATGDLSPAGQARFFLGEDPQLVANLNNAQSLEEAQTLMNNAWRFAGFNRPGGETAERIAASRGFLPQFQGSQTVDASPQVQAAPNVSVTLPAQVSAAPQASINPAILQSLSNPRSSPQERAIAQSLLQQQQAQQQFNRDQQAQRDNFVFQQEYQRNAQQSDPLRQAQIEHQQLQNQALRNPQPKITDTQRNLQFRAEQAGLQPGTPEYQQFMATGGGQGTNITVNTGETDKFYENLDKKNAETFSSLSESGVGARSRIAQLNQLDNLLQQNPTGATAAIKLALGDYGVNSEGLDGLQATRALIEKLVPEQRQAGSGPMSDMDIVMYRRSLPSVMNQPDGNRLIIGTARAIAQYDMQMGEIADRVADREISPAEGRRMIRDLRNPLDDYREQLKARGINTSGQQSNVNPQQRNSGVTVGGINWSID